MYNNDIRDDESKPVVFFGFDSRTADVPTLRRFARNWHVVADMKPGEKFHEAVRADADYLADLADRRERGEA